VNGKREPFVFDVDTSTLRQGALQTWSHKGNLTFECRHPVAGLEAMVAYDLSQRHAVETTRDVGAASTRNDGARVRTTHPSEQRTCTSPHLGVLTVHDDRGKRPVEVECEQYARPRELCESFGAGPRQYVVHETTAFGVALDEEKRPDILSRLRNSAASTSIRPAHR